MSGSHREVRDIVKTVVCSKVHFINSCSIYRLMVLPFTEETTDDISLATSLIVPLLFLSLFPSPTPPLLHLPFLLALFFPCFCFLIFLYLVVVFVLFRLLVFVLLSITSVAGGICQPFHFSLACFLCSFSSYLFGTHCSLPQHPAAFVPRERLP